jgi:ElaB/YqjD/DUF883 family membrane-anchored ribosome-binding protein
MNMASFLKLVAGDLGSEIRRIPYGAAGTAAALGLFAGMLVSRRHRHDA